MVVKKIQKIFLFALILEILHMPIEVFVFRADHAVYADAKAVFDWMVNRFVGLTGNLDEAFIYMIGVFGLCWLLTTYLMLKGDKYQLGIMIFFSLLFLSEIHHLIRSILLGTYYPGTIIGLIITIFGIILFIESIKTMRNLNT